jgi:ribonuclease P protein component
MMGAAVDRLKRRPEFLRAARRGRSCATPGLVLQVYSRGDGDAPLRVGYTASKKVGNAVIRNRARRRLRAVVDAMAMRRAKAGRDYVLIARAGTPARNYAALERDFETALKRLDAWQADEADETGRAE